MKVADSRVYNLRNVNILWNSFFWSHARSTNPRLGERIWNTSFIVKQIEILLYKHIFKHNLCIRNNCNNARSLITSSLSEIMHWVSGRLERTSVWLFCLSVLNISVYEQSAAKVLCVATAGFSVISHSSEYCHMECLCTGFGMEMDLLDTLTHNSWLHYKCHCFTHTHTHPLSLRSSPVCWWRLAAAHVLLPQGSLNGLCASATATHEWLTNHPATTARNEYYYGVSVYYGVYNWFYSHSGNELTDNPAKRLLCRSRDHVEILARNWEFFSEHS
jgi:hypothetical protein